MKTSVVEVLHCEETFDPAMYFASMLVCWNMKFSYSYNDKRAIFFITDLGNWQNGTIVEWFEIECHNCSVSWWL